jgi:hypothetical protein
VALGNKPDEAKVSSTNRKKISEETRRHPTHIHLQKIRGSLDGNIEAAQYLKAAYT